MQNRKIKTMMVMVIVMIVRETTTNLAYDSNRNGQDPISGTVELQQQAY